MLSILTSISFSVEETSLERDHNSIFLLHFNESPCEALYKVLQRGLHVRSALLYQPFSNRQCLLYDIKLVIDRCDIFVLQI
jgi:hypothetical protein